MHPILVERKDRINTTPDNGTDLGKVKVDIIKLFCKYLFKKYINGFYCGQFK